MHMVFAHMEDAGIYVLVFAMIGVFVFQVVLRRRLH